MQRNWNPFGQKQALKRWEHLIHLYVRSGEFKKEKKIGISDVPYYILAEHSFFVFFSPHTYK